MENCRDTGVETSERQNLMFRTFTGSVKSGQGKGRDFIDALEKDDWLKSFFTEPIFPGTLAVHMRLPIPMKTDLNLLELHSRTYYFPGMAGGIPLILKWCATYPARFQVISTVNLRKKFGLNDNSKFIFIPLTLFENGIAGKLPAGICIVYSSVLTPRICAELPGTLRRTGTAWHAAAARAT